MIVLKLIASVVLTVIAILLFRYGAKARERERERDEMPMLSFDSYGAGILVLIIAGFLFFSVIA